MTLVDEYILEEVLAEFQKKVDISLEGVIKKYDINYQVEEATKALKSEWDGIDSKRYSIKRNIAFAFSTVALNFYMLHSKQQGTGYNDNAKYAQIG